MPSDLTLAPLQQWMQTVVTHLGTVESGLALAEATQFVSPDRLAEVVLPSASLDPAARVGIYHGMYLMRMVEALQADYPAVEYFLGQHQFGHLVEDFVVRHPSRSYTLNRLGDGLPAFIAESEVPRKRFLQELARFELAMTQVFDEQERPPMPADAIAAVAPADLERLRLTPIPALRLLEFQYDVVASYQAFREGTNPARRRARTFVALYRQNYSVLRMTLERPAYTLLRSMADGETLGSALQIFQRQLRRLPDQLELFHWFRDWSAAGLFASMSCSAEETS